MSAPPTLTPYSPTDRMTDGGTNTLAAHEMEEPFFPVVLLCQFFGSGGK
jgi:hypothetical protein